MVTKRKFQNLFFRALNLAVEHAEKKLGRPVPRLFLIELHAPKSAGEIMTVEQALDRIYASSTRFFRIIDVAVKSISDDRTIAFVRVSGHTLGPFSQTWDPADLGPFKQIFAETIEDRRVHA